MQRLLIDQRDITQTSLDQALPPSLSAGEARLRLDHCALTANNVTYAACGFSLNYWQFFPSGVEGQGLLPVWGVAEVVESEFDELAVGARLYGFWPLASQVCIRPRVDTSGAVVDTAVHRAELAAVYNRYAPVSGANPDMEHLRALLQPLLATSYLIDDWLQDNAMFGADQIIIGSASSKTGLGLCKFLAEHEARSYRIIGLTSDGNRAFVEGQGACDQVLSYDEISQIGQIPSVYVDMAGNGAVKSALHHHLQDQLKHSSAVGLSHWDKFEPKQNLPGAKPQFFFAPAQIAKRREEWGTGVIEGKITEAWKRIASSASDWVDVKLHDDLAEAEQVFGALARGEVNPRDGHIVKFPGVSP